MKLTVQYSHLLVASVLVGRDCWCVSVLGIPLLSICGGTASNVVVPLADHLAIINDIIKQSVSE